LLIASTTVAACVGSAVGGIFYVLVDDSAQAISLWVKNGRGLPIDLSACTIFDVPILMMYLLSTGIAGGVSPPGSSCCAPQIEI
jgi:branched-chain amino acid transport system permease protein